MTFDRRDTIKRRYEKIWKLGIIKRPRKGYKGSLAGVDEEREREIKEHAK